MSFCEETDSPHGDPPSRNPYQKRPRRKTKESRYELKTGLAAEDLDQNTYDRKKRRFAGKGDKSSRHNERFQALNVRPGRLTVYPNKLGIFKKGKTSSPVYPSEISYLDFSERDFLANESKYVERVKSLVGDAKSRKGTSMEDVARRFDPSVSQRSSHIDSSDPSGYRFAQQYWFSRDPWNPMGHAGDELLKQRHALTQSSNPDEKEKGTRNRPESTSVARDNSPRGSSTAIEEYLSSILRDCHQLEASCDAIEFRVAPLQPSYTLEDLKSLCYARERTQNLRSNEDSRETHRKRKVDAADMDYAEIRDIANNTEYRMASDPLEGFLNSPQLTKVGIGLSSETGHHFRSKTPLETAQDRMDPFVLDFDGTHVYSGGLAGNLKILPDNDRDILDSRMSIDFESARQENPCGVPPKFAFEQASGLNTPGGGSPLIPKCQPCWTVEPSMRPRFHQEEQMGPKVACPEKHRVWRQNKLY